MEDIYLSIKEAAEIENVSYPAFKMRLLRSTIDDNIKVEKNISGGRDKKYIKLSALSKNAQKTYKELHKEDHIEGSDLIVEEIKKSTESPWYLDVDINWYIQNNKSAYYRAVELSNEIRAIIEYNGADKTEFVRRKAVDLGSSQRTIYRQIDTYIEASGWALKMLKESGANYDFYKVLCLCRKPKDAGTFPTFSPEIKQLIRNIWMNKDFAANQGTREMLYTKLVEVSLETGWTIPSYPSVCRYITHLMEVEKMAGAHFLAANGIRTYKNQQMIKALRDTRQLKVMEVVMGDEHTFDCWVSYKSKNGKVIAIRPKLVAWIDVRSRMVMGDVICQDANSQILKESIIKMLYSENGGLPKYLYIDNGKDYTSETMTGIPRKERYPGFESSATGFYGAVGIEDYHRSKPYEPWSKSEIERLFSTVCNGFSKWFKSYTGTLTGSKTSAKVNKDITKLLQQGKLLTIEEFYEAWSNWLANVYAKKVHRGLKDMHEDYTTPLSLYKNGEQYEKALPPKSYAVMMLMQAETARVYNYGIKKFNYTYTSQELAHFIGKTVNIKYDKDDVTKLYIFDLDGKMVCEALSQELLQIAPSVPQEALVDHIKAQKMQIKRDREILQESTTPLDERIAGAADANRIVGGMMIEGSGHKDKVIALPVTQEYKEEVKRRKAGKSEYIAGMGNETVNKLKNLG